MRSSTGSKISNLRGGVSKGNYGLYCRENILIFARFADEIHNKHNHHYFEALE